MKVNNAKIDILMAKRRLSLSRLRDSGLSPATLSKIRKGEDVLPATVGKLAEKLGVDVAELIEVKEV